jgi:class 3 adenylate cyclase
VSEAEALFTLLRQSADGDAVAAVERMVREAPDRALSNINPLALAAAEGIGEDRLIAALLHGARLGLFEMSWNVVCRSCAGIMDANTTLKTLNQPEYKCAFCAATYETTLDHMVEVTFTVSPRLRKIAAHGPDELPAVEYYRQIFWSSAIELPADYERLMRELTLEIVELPAGERAILSLQLPAGIVIIFDPVTHSAQFVEARGEPSGERQSLSQILSSTGALPTKLEMRPGPVRLALENRTNRRVLPTVWIADETLEAFLGRRRPALTAKQLLTNQTFRDIYRTDTLAVDQRLKITSLTFLFSDLKGSTELYEQVGDLVAFDLVKEHFRVLNEIIASERGAVVKTIGDAVMATFATPDRAVSAAIRMREAIHDLGAQRHQKDLLLKLGIHEGPCLAVSLNDRQDYFGQTVNIASRVQALAASRSILATEPVVDNPQAAALLETSGLKPVMHRAALRGISDEVAVYEIP